MRPNTIAKLTEEINELKKLEAKTLYYMEDEKKATGEYEDFSRELTNVGLFIPSDTLLKMSRDESRHRGLLDNVHLAINSKIIACQNELDSLVTKAKPQSKGHDDSVFGFGLVKRRCK